MQTSEALMSREKDDACACADFFAPIAATAIAAARQPPLESAATAFFSASDRPTFCGTRALTDINETKDTSESGNDHDYD
jgi:hypothetical protein